MEVNKLHGTIGIDLSMTSTGVVVLDNNKAVEEFFTIKTSPKTNIYKRSLQVADKINQVILKYPNYDVYLEAPAFLGKGSRVYQLFGFHYFIATLIYRHKNNSYQIAPSSLKKKATGNGRANKEDMLDALPKNIKKFFVDNDFKKTTGLYDLTDAYFLAYYGDK